jgi:hypothetical protein
MAEAFQRTHSDRTTYGYRQLAGTGPGSGPELKTLVFATVGTALGIVFGTILASGGLRGTNEAASLHPVQAGTIAAVSTPAPKPDATQTAKAVTAAPVAAAVSAATAVQPATAKSAVAQSSTPVKTSAAHTVAVSQGQLVHGTTSRKRHLVRRWHHVRHRIYPTRQASIPAGAPTVLEAPMVDITAKPFIFMVEGDVSVASYDALTRTIDTYEGESFSLDQASSGNTEVALQDSVPTVHYRCDQSGNCDLVRAGQTFLNTRRTK